eukprot:jgi/Tetstr1/447906/TSEL_035214.t1
MSPTAATRFQSGRVGSTLKGRELDQCYSGPVDAQAYRHGDGSYVYPNAHFAYEGGYTNGLKQGHGRLTIGDGYYEGAFADGEIQGEGVRVWSDGSSFTGTFVHGEPSGPGVWVGANGARYEGEFQGYTRHGEGTLQLANGDKYVGTFRAHKYDGHGEYLAADGWRYAGGWAAGLKHGDGEQMWPDGSYYKGGYVEDAQHGTGEAYSATTGITYRGEFVSGNPTIAPERLSGTSPAPPDMSVKSPVFPEATTGEVVPFEVTVEVQYKTETILDKPPEDDKPRSRGGKKGGAEPVAEGPYVSTEWHAAIQESGRELKLTIHAGDLTAVPAEELAAAEVLPFDPMTPDIMELCATAVDGRATFGSFMLGRPAPPEEEEEEEGGEGAEEAADAGEEELEEAKEFEGGVYTVRIAADGLQPYGFKLNVLGPKSDKDKKDKKGGKGGNKKK